MPYFNIALCRKTHYYKLNSLYKLLKIPRTNKTKDAETRKHFKLNETRVTGTEARRTETDRRRTTRVAMKGRKMRRDRLLWVGVVGVWELGEPWQNRRLRDKLARGTTKLLFGIGQGSAGRMVSTFQVTIAALCHLSLL